MNYLKIFFTCFLLIRVCDFTLKKILKKNEAYYLLHALFNLWVTYNTFNEFLYIILNPLKIYDNNKLYSYIGVKTTIEIMVFHIHHSIFYSNLSVEDWIHHIVSSIIVAFLGIILPFGKIVSAVNIILCGIPGGIDYLLLFFVKRKYIKKMTEKWINRYLNLLIRWPFMFLSVYIFLINIYQNKISTNLLPLMLFTGLLHCFNAIYYCDKVIGNYYLKLNDI